MKKFLLILLLIFGGCEPKREKVGDCCVVKVTFVGASWGQQPGYAIEFDDGTVQYFSGTHNIFKVGERGTLYKNTGWFGP